MVAFKTLLAVVVVAVIAACQVPPPGQAAAVVSLTDGDTLRVSTGEKIRLIGIDTPETKDPRKPVQCFGKEASAALRALIPPGTPVVLVNDVEANDRYRRRLAYVYRAADGLFVNAEMVRQGFASAYTYPPNVAHSEEFVRLAGEARAAGRGLWGACGGIDSSPSTPAPPALLSSGPCDANYQGACIPVYPPDLDCGEIGARNFAVVGRDVHRFDANHDGIACVG